MTDEPECTLRRRKPSGNPNLPLNLDVEYHVRDGDPDLGTPSPSVIKRASLASTKQKSSSSALLDFKNKQQSFDIQVEECEEEEIIIESDDDADDEDNADGVDDRSVTPTPIQDFAANVVYTEGPQVTDFLRVKAIEKECYTDVSDDDTEEEEE